MQRLKPILVASILLIVMLGIFSNFGAARAASTIFSSSSITCGKWNVVSSPNASSALDILYGVAPISATDVWAVGGAGNAQEPVAEHYNGTKWSIVATPTLSNQGYLTSVTAVSTSDVWAVGVFMDSSFVQNTLVEHWNGTAWSIVASPNRGTAGSAFYGVTAVSATNIWAVGSSLTANFTSQTLIEHYNGTKWSIINSPGGPGQMVNLNGVTFSTAKDGWAVGYTNGATQTLVEHYNGTKWSIVASPNPAGSGYTALSGVTIISGKDVWAVGYADGSGSFQTLTEQWNGTKWSIVASPNPSSATGSFLYGVAASSASNVWAIGQYYKGIPQFNLIEQWNGKQWKIIASPNPSSTDNSLNGIGRVPGTKNFWSAGDFYSGSTRKTLTEYYC